jgi:hypothetical protein
VRHAVDVLARRVQRTMRRATFVRSSTAAALCLPAGLAVPARAEPVLHAGATAFGVQSHMVGPNPRQLDLITGAGFRLMRVPFVHWFLHRVGDGWNFAPYDRLAAACAKRGITLLFTTGNPRADFALEDYTKAAELGAARFPDALWEVCNEPNNPPYWHVGPATPQSYLSVAMPTVAALKRGNPRALVTTAGSSGVVADWHRVLAAGGAFAAGAFDACGVHPYGETAATVASSYTRVRAAIPARVPIWATEYGTVDPQPVDVRSMYDAHAALHVPLFVWYEIQDNLVEGNVARYGLVDADFAPRAAYDTAKEINASVAPP